MKQQGVAVDAVVALEESEERFRQFADASQDLLWIRDAGTLEWEYLSPAFEKIYGLSREAALEGDTMSNWLAMIHPDDRALALDRIEQVRAGEQVTFEYRIRRPVDGQERWLRNTDFPMRDAAGEIVRIGGVGQDVTELKAIEAALVEAERRQRALIEGISQLVWRARNDGEIIWVSPQAVEFTGVAADRLLGRGWIEVLHPEDQESIPRWEAAAQAGFAEMQVRILHGATQSWRWFQIRARALFDEKGAVTEWLGTATDIDDLLALQERQRVLVAELQHRTRNLLIVVRSLADRIGRASTDLEDFRTRFTDQLEALARVQGLLSRLEGSDRITFDELIASELRAMGADEARVTLSGPEGVRLRSSTVQMLALALHELATNAVKYGALGQKEAHLAISWSLEPAPPGSDDPPILHVDWRESGVEVPTERLRPGGGQGRELIERALPYQLDAVTNFEIGKDGVHCTISFPVSATTPRPERLA